MANSPDQPERHLTLRAAVQWSEDLLSPEQQPLSVSSPFSPDESAAAFAEARRAGRRRVGSVYETAGPLLAPGDVASRLGVTRATVHNWRQAGRLLALHPNQHTYVYPAFQFTEPTESEDGLLVGLADVLAALAGLSPLGTALWFQAKQPSLGGRTPVEVLRADRGNGLGSVLAAAPAAYAQGSW